jgi:flagellin
MARINTNISSVIAQSHLARSQRELSLRFERLSTGLRINRGADDPAGLIVSERIKSDLNGINSGVKNSERASSVIATTEAALNEASDLLNSIKSLMVEAANTGGNSVEERTANQLQIDSALDSITRISNTASFGRLKLLNGSLDYTLSGIKTSAITTAKVWNASLVNQPNLQVTVDVVASAQKAGLYYNPGVANPGRLLSAMSIEVAGAKGVQIFQFPISATLSSVVAAVNNTTSFTGVNAALINGNVNSGISFTSGEYGSEQFVSVKRIGAPAVGNSWDTVNFANNAAPTLGSPANWALGTLQSASRDNGQDVQALVNGALGTGRGLALSTNGSTLGVDLVLHEDFATDPTLANSTFNITGGGALFQLGQDITAQQQTNLGIPSMATSSLGGVLISGKVQYLSSLKTGQGYSISDSVRSGDFTQANAILDRAIDEISTLRGRLGAFERNVLQTNVRSLQSAFENLSSSNSQIRDADFAAETSNMTRAQILSSSGTSVLGLANQQSQQVLQLLG